MTMPMTPAQFVVKVFGSQTAVAKILDIEVSAVNNWLNPRMKKKGGGNGLVPSKHHEKLLKAARSEGLELTANHLVYGDKSPPG